MEGVHQPEIAPPGFHPHRSLAFPVALRYPMPMTSAPSTDFARRLRLSASREVNRLRHAERRKVSG